MKRFSKCFVVAAAALACAGTPRRATAQVIGQPEPGPQPAPVIRYYPAPLVKTYTPPPVYLRPTAYSFNGPSPATIGYVLSTTTYYQPSGSNRVYSATTNMPVLGYQPGYYRDYYTPLFYRP